MKEILHIQNLAFVIKGQYLFFDTSSLIAIINHLELFGKLLNDLVDSKCTFLTIPSVIFEFTRSDLIDTYDKRVRFIKTNGISVYPIENHKDFLTSILDRKFIISVDTDIDMIRNLGFYQISNEKYQKAAQSILRK